MNFITEPKDIEELYPLVVKECELIKEHFSEELEELLELEITEFETDYKTGCIYGKLVGNCNDIRVTNFIQNNLDTVIIGKYYDSTPINNDRTLLYMTPLEEYIWGYAGEEELADEDYNYEAKERLQKVLNLLK